MNEPSHEQRGYSVLEALRQPVICLHIFIGIAGLIIFHTRMITRANNEGSLIAVLVGALGLIFRWTISPVLFLILLTYLLIDPNFRGLLLQDWQYAYRSDMYSNVLLCASILTYLIAQYRVLGFVQQSMPFDPPPRRKGQPEPAVPRRPVELVSEREPMTAVAVGLGGRGGRSCSLEFRGVVRTFAAPGSHLGHPASFRPGHAVVMDGGCGDAADKHSLPVYHDAANEPAAGAADAAGHVLAGDSARAGTDPPLANLGAPADDRLSTGD